MAETSDRNIWDILGGVNAPPLVSGVNGPVTNGVTRPPVSQPMSFAHGGHALFESKNVSADKLGFSDIKLPPRYLREEKLVIPKLERPPGKRLSQNIFSKLQKKLKIDPYASSETKLPIGDVVEPCVGKESAFHVVSSCVAPLDLSNRGGGDYESKGEVEKPLNLSIKNPLKQASSVPSFHHSTLQRTHVVCDSSVAVDSTTADDDVRFSPPPIRYAVDAVPRLYSTGSSSSKSTKRGQSISVVPVHQSPTQHAHILNRQVQCGSVDKASITSPPVHSSWLGGGIGLPNAVAASATYFEHAPHARTSKSKFSVEFLASSSNSSSDSLAARGVTNSAIGSERVSLNYENYVQFPVELRVPKIPKKMSPRDDQHSLRQQSLCPKGSRQAFVHHQPIALNLAESNVQTDTCYQASGFSVTSEQSHLYPVSATVSRSDSSIVQLKTISQHEKPHLSTLVLPTLGSKCGSTSINMSEPQVSESFSKHRLKVDELAEGPRSAVFQTNGENLRLCTEKSSEMTNEASSDKKSANISVLPTTRLPLDIQVGSLRHISSSSQSPCEALTADIVSPPMPVLSPHTPCGRKTPQVLQTSSSTAKEVMVENIANSYCNDASSSESGTGESVSSTTIIADVAAVSKEEHPTLSNRNACGDTGVAAVQKHPAFEVANSFNETFLNEVRTSACTLFAFDKSLLDNKDRKLKDFIASTRYFKGIMRKSASGLPSAPSSDDRTNLASGKGSTGRIIVSPKQLSNIRSSSPVRQVTRKRRAIREQNLVPKVSVELTDRSYCEKVNPLEDTIPSSNSVGIENCCDRVTKERSSADVSGALIVSPRSQRAVARQRANIATVKTPTDHDIISRGCSPSEDTCKSNRMQTVKRSLQVGLESDFIRVSDNKVESSRANSSSVMKTVELTDLSENHISRVSDRFRPTHPTMFESVAKKVDESITLPSCDLKTECISQTRESKDDSKKLKRSSNSKSVSVSLQASVSLSTSSLLVKTPDKRRGLSKNAECERESFELAEIAVVRMPKNSSRHSKQSLETAMKGRRERSVTESQEVKPSSALKLQNMSDVDEHSSDFVDEGVDETNLSLMDNSVDSDHLSGRSEKKGSHKKKKGILYEIANSDGFVADKLTKKSETKNLFVEPSKLNREERAIQMALMRITRMEIKAALGGRRAPCRQEVQEESRYNQSQTRALASSTNNKLSQLSKSNGKPASRSSESSRTKRQTTVSDHRASARVSPMKYQRDVVFNNINSSRRDAKTAWARRCVKRHTKICRGQFKLRLNRKDEKENSSVKEEMTVEDVKFSSEIESKLSSLAPLTVNTNAASSDYVKITSTLKLSPLKFSPGSSPLYHGGRSISHDCGMTLNWLKMNIPDYVKKLMVFQTTGETVLHRAARLGYEDAVQWCCQTRFVDVNARDNAGYTPLHVSCIGGHVNIARFLIQYGADVNAASRLDGARPLHDAVETDNVQLVRLLLASGADLTLVTYSEKTVLSLAQSLEMKEFLRAHLNDINGGRDFDVVPDWKFEPSWNKAGEEDDGFDVLAGAPCDDDSDVGFSHLVFECSRQPFIPIYLLNLDGQRQADNYLLLNHVLEQVGLTHDQFVTAHRNEVVVYKVNQKALQSNDNPVCEKYSDSKPSIVDERVELVRMCDVVRRLLNIDVIPVTGQRL